MDARVDRCVEDGTCEDPKPIAIRFQIEGRLLEGTYEVRGHMMIARCDHASTSACIGLLDHRRLAKALLKQLDARSRRADADADKKVKAQRSSAGSDAATRVHDQAL